MIMMIIVMVIMIKGNAVCVAWEGGRVIGRVRGVEGEKKEGRKEGV